MSETIQGMSELNKKLKALGKVAGGKILRQAAMLATKPILDEAKAKVPRGNKAHKTYKGRIVAPGFASRNLVRRSKLSRDKQTVWVNIGVRGEAYYALQFLELGTKYHAKQPWLTPAHRRKKPEAIKRFGEKLKIKIEAAAKK